MAKSSTNDRINSIFSRVDYEKKKKAQNANISTRERIDSVFARVDGRNTKRENERKTPTRPSHLSDDTSAWWLSGTKGITKDSRNTALSNRIEQEQKWEGEYKDYSYSELQDKLYIMDKESHRYKWLK